MRVNPLELVSCGVIIINEDKKVVVWNSIASQILGLKSRQAMGRDIRSFMEEVETEIDDVIRDMVQVINNKSMVIAPKRLIKWRNHWVEIDIDSSKDSTGKPLCVLSFIDVTTYQEELIIRGNAIKKMEAEIKLLRKSDSWVRRLVLKSLFISVGVFITLAILADLLDLSSADNIFAVVTSFISMLSLAIGFYFKSEMEAPLKENVESFKPYYDNSQKETLSPNGTGLENIHDSSTWEIN